MTREVPLAVGQVREEIVHLGAVEAHAAAARRQVPAQHHAVRAQVELERQNVKAVHQILRAVSIAATRRFMCQHGFQLGLPHHSVAPFANRGGQHALQVRLVASHEGQATETRPVIFVPKFKRIYLPRHLRGEVGGCVPQPEKKDERPSASTTRVARTIASGRRD